MKLQNFILFLLLSILLSCSKEEEIIMGPSDNAIYLTGEITIDNALESDEDQDIVVTAGSIITFTADGILVAKGDLYVQGTEEDPVQFFGSQDVVNHRIIKGDWSSQNFIIGHAEITDGLVTSTSKWNHIHDVTFVNTKPLIWSDALIRFWNSPILIEDCTMIGINRGDGILVHDVEGPIVRNCVFYDTPDAVEYINCTNGIITGNKVYNSGDDGVDLNGCSDIEIRDNEFYGVKDRALEIGSESFGSSESILIDNNLFVECKIGVNLKDASNALVKNCTFYNGSYVLEVTNEPGVDTPSICQVESSVLVGSMGSNIHLEENAEAIIMNSISDLSIDLVETNNRVSEVNFVDPENSNFTINEAQFPAGYNASNIGYQR